MKTIQMALDDNLVVEVDKVVKKLKTNRSAFARQALQHAIADFYTKELETQQVQGYQKNPVQDN